MQGGCRSGSAPQSSPMPRNHNALTANTATCDPCAQPFFHKLILNLHISFIFPGGLLCGISALHSREYPCQKPPIQIASQNNKFIISIRRSCGGTGRARRASPRPLHCGATTTAEEEAAVPAGAQPPGIRGLRLAATVATDFVFF